MPEQSVSVIIPTYNRADVLVEAVESVLAQTAVPHEIIVVDDGSTDATEQAVVRFGARIRYVKQANAGVAAARNHGLRLSTGALLAFLDSDDVWAREKIELQLAQMRVHPELALLGTRVFPWPGPSPAGENANSFQEISWERLVIRNQFTASSVVVRRRALEASGNFDESLFGMEDHDLWLRIAERFRVGYLDAAVTGYRDSSGSLGKRASPMRRGMLRLLAKVDERQAWRGRRLLRRRAFSFLHYQTALLYRESGDWMAVAKELAYSCAWCPWGFPKEGRVSGLPRTKLLLVSAARLLRARAPVTRV